jgi:hypothetical protein
MNRTEYNTAIDACLKFKNDTLEDWIDTEGNP